jgi:outer membrane receptor for ferric coprogen and ferric-rhodotorulic acid
MSKKNQGPTAAAFLLVLALRAFDAAAADEASARCELDVSSQMLDGALQEVARQCDVQLIYFSGITGGMTAAQLSGQYSLDDALNRLLKDTGLSFRHVNAQTIEIRRAGAARPINARIRRQEEPEPQEVVIRGTAEGLVATRIETPLREISQTISIISAEQMRLQNNFTLNEALEDAVGIMAVREDSLFQNFYSRGFQIMNFTIDGGGALRPFSKLRLGSLLLTPDLGEFDHVEVLRGSNALFDADGLPGGAINLVRKRPRHQADAVFTSSAGSWDNFRQEIDVTGPLARDGAVRGRLDASYTHRGYFYDLAREERGSLFGVIDYDLTPDTLLTVGGSFSKSDARPFEVGLPRFSNGEDPRFSRTMSYTFEWSRLDTKVGEVYLRLEQAFGANWRLKVNATWLDSNADYAFGRFFRAVDATTGGISLGPSASYTLEPPEQEQLNLEATLSGTADWWGRAVEMAVGADFLRSASSSHTGEISFGEPLADAYRFDPAAYPNPFIDPDEGISESQDTLQKLNAIFASLRIQLTDPWSVTAGLRVSNQHVTDELVSYFPGFEFPLTFDYRDKDKITPFLGTAFSVNDTWSLYASYSNIFLSNRGLVRSDESVLSPSDGITMEAGLKGAWRDGALNGSLALFRIEERGVALIDPEVAPTTPECCWTSRGKNTSRGVDLELTGRLAPGWLIGTGYTFNESRQVFPGQTLVEPFGKLTPRHLFKLWTDYQLPGSWQRWSVGGTLRAQSKSFIDLSICQVLSDFGFCLSGFQDFRLLQKSYAVVSPRLGFRFTPRWQASFTVNNLFDHRYYETLGGTAGGNFYGEPRNFLLRLDGRF